MKKLIVLLAISTMVGATSAATITVGVTAGGKGMTSPYAIEGVAYDQYFISYTVKGTDGPNALELNIWGHDNIGVFASGNFVDSSNPSLGYNADFGPWIVGTRPQYTLSEDVGHSSIDSLVFSGYTVGAQTTDEVLDTAYGAYLVSEARVAFAQRSGFSTFTPRLATIYVASGTYAYATLQGGFGDGSKLELLSPWIPVPEPTALGLLATGVVGLLRKLA